MLDLILPVFKFDEVRGGVGNPKGSEDTLARGGQSLATPELFFFACLNRDWTVFSGAIYGSSSSDVVT